MPSLQALLSAARRDIGGDTADLDAEVLLCHVLGRTRTWLWTWPDQVPESAQVAHFQELVARRCLGEPVAYLTGEREFWSLTLAVSPSTLIPRGDTECLVERALALPLPVAAHCLDLGTGTGAIALALAFERPSWQVTGVDLQQDAVQLALRNARRHGLERVRLLESRWFSALADDVFFDVIVSNPPYIDPADPHLAEGDVRFEPRSALVAEQQGLADLFYIIEQARHRLRDSGWLLLEHGFDQAERVRAHLIHCGYRCVSTTQDLAGQERVSGGCWPGRAHRLDRQSDGELVGKSAGEPCDAE